MRKVWRYFYRAYYSANPQFCLLIVIIMIDFNNEMYITCRFDLLSPSFVTRHTCGGIIATCLVFPDAIVNRLLLSSVLSYPMLQLFCEAKSCCKRQAYSKSCVSITILTYEYYTCTYNKSQGKQISCCIFVYKQYKMLA